MSAYEIIQKKRDGAELSEAEIRFLIQNYTEGRIPDYQMSAFAMAVYFRGMTDGETALFTDAMAHSGDMVDLSRFGDRSVDKHSTGGVGDKTTLVVAPLVASLGAKVAKMTGRGLGHTGGTVDKLESIPGFHIALSREDMLRQVEELGIAVAGQSGDLAPADKKLYALRDVTATVDSMPLIVSSIMSKKLAAGAKSIVLDVKVGSGSFSPTLDYAQRLAEAMIRIGTSRGRNMAAVLTNMDRPLGFAVGNALEVREAIALMQGEDIPDLRAVCLELAANMLHLSLGIPYAEAQGEAVEALASGRALTRFRQWIRAQGGDDACVDDPSRLPASRISHPVKAERSGYLRHMDTKAVGRVCVALGAGRRTMDDPIEYGAGVRFARKTGDYVSSGDVIATLYTNREEELEAASASLLSALEIGVEAPEALPTVYKVLHSAV